MLQKEIALFDNNITLEGIYIGEVISGKDPKMRGRALVRIIGLHDFEDEDESNSIWAEMCSPTQHGFEAPEIGNFVYIMFRSKFDPSSAIYLGYVNSNFVDGI